MILLILWWKIIIIHIEISSTILNLMIITYIALMSYSSMIKLSKKLIKNSRIMGIKLVEVKM